MASITRHSSAAAHVLATLLIGAVGGFTFILLSLPLPWMLGSLTATLIGSLLGFNPRVPVPLFTAMLTLLGIYAGSALSPDLLASLLQWPLTLLGMLVLVAATIDLNARYYQRFAGFDRITSLFAAMPGAQSLVLIMGLRHVTDEKKILIPQLTRVLAVVYFVPLLLVTFGGWAGIDTEQVEGVPQEAWVLPSWEAMILVAVAVAVGIVAAKRMRWPQPTLLGPLCAVALLQVSGATELSIPGQALIPVQFVLGTFLGTRFARVRWRAALALSGHGIIALLLTVLLALLMTLLLTLITDIPPAAIFLAFAPGGLPEMVLIAATLNLDPAFVVVHQLTRFLIIALMLPWAAARYAGPDRP